MTADEHNQDRLLEKKLLEKHLTKRMRLTSSPAIQSIRSDSVSSFMTNLKTLFAQVSSTHQESMNRIREFKQAVTDYKTDLLENETSRSSTSVVDVLFSKLAKIFLPLECPGLLQGEIVNLIIFLDAVCFVVPEHSVRFTELSENLTGIPILPNSSSSILNPNNISGRFTLYELIIFKASI